MKIGLPSRNLNRLGIAVDKREYDLPFNDDRANRFLILLIGLMTFLALLSGAAGMVLSNMADRWTSGLSNRLTIEIPTMDATGLMLPDAAQKDRLNSIETILKGETDIAKSTIQTPAEVGKLVEPWLGAGDKILGQVPLPALITVELENDDLALPERLQTAISRVVPDARVETHQSWLNDLLRLTGTLSFASYLIGFITAITTIMAVAGAVRARMAAHHEQLEILHLIGATDEYICRQFQKHALQLSFIGSGIGFVFSMLTLAIIDQLAGAVELTMIPALILSNGAIFIMLLIPMLACLITVLTTRLTVLQSLREMP